MATNMLNIAALEARLGSAYGCCGWDYYRADEENEASTEMVVETPIGSYTAKTLTAALELAVAALNEG